MTSRIFLNSLLLLGPLQRVSYLSAPHGCGPPSLISMLSPRESSLGSEDECVPDGPWCWENFDFPNQIPWCVDNTVLVASGSCAYGALFPSGQLHLFPPQPEAAQWAEMLQRSSDPTSLREVWLQALDQHKVTSPGFMEDALYASVYARDLVCSGKITDMFLEYHLD